MLSSHEKNFEVDGWAALPNIPCHGPTRFAALKNHFIWMLCRFSTTFKWTAGRVSPKTVQGVSRCWRLYWSWWYEAFQKRSNLWLGRVPANTTSSVHGVEKPFRLDVMQPCKNIQVYGWAAFPNKPCHGPAQFAALKNHFVLMQCRFLTTFKWTDGPVPSNTVPLIPRWWKTFSSGWCDALQKHSNLRLGCAPPNTAQFLLRCWRIYFYGCYAAMFKPGPRSPTFPVTAQLISRRWRIISFWCYADFHQCSNKRLVVFPQTRSRSFDGMEELFRLDAMKLFKNIRTYGWAVLPQTQPKFFHGVEKHVRLDDMLPFKNIEVDAWAALPNIPCHGPAHFAALKNHFVLMLCRLSTTFKRTDGRALSNTVQLVSRF